MFVYTGPELDKQKLNELIYTRVDVPSIFNYPKNGLLPLQSILTAKQIKTPDSLKLDGDPVRRVLMRGSASKTTVGTVSCFRAFARQYYLNETKTKDSLEIPIFSHEDSVEPFSKGGDSGAIIISPTGQFVGLLTGGANSGTKGSDITFATPFEWVWKLVKQEFPEGTLSFDVSSFLADVQA